MLLENDLQAVGGVSLSGSRIGRNLRCGGGKFKSVTAGQAALRMTTLEVCGNAKLGNGVYRYGPVDLTGATIDGDLNVENATFCQSAFKATNLYVKDCFHWRKVTWRENEASLQKNGPKLDLRNAKVGILIDEHKSEGVSHKRAPEKEWLSWPKELDLEGFAYDRLIGSNEPKERNKLLKRWDSYRKTQWHNALRHKFVACRARETSSQPYQQLAQVLRDGGHERQADQVLIYKHWAELRALVPWERWWLVFLDVVVFAFLVCAGFKFPGTLVYMLNLLNPLVFAALIAGLAGYLLWRREVRESLLYLLTGFGYCRWLPVAGSLHCS